MNFKINKYLIGSIVILLAFTTIASIGFYVYQPQAKASASASTIIQQHPVNQQVANIIPTSAPSNEVLSQTANGVTVDVTYTKIIPTGIEIGICYTTLDGGDWYSAPGHLFFSTYEIYPDEAGFASEAKADSKNLGKRCEFVRYKINDLKSITTPIQFSVNQIYASPMEMYTPCKYFQQRLATNPKANADGLKASCTENNDGSISVGLTDYTKSMLQDDAKKELDDIASGVVKGPWQFTIINLTK